MSLLTSSDVVALTRAQRVLLSPLEHASTHAWARATGDVLQDLFHADQAVVTIGGPGGETLVAEGVEHENLQAYEETFAERDRAGALVLARPRPYYVEAEFEGDPVFEAHAASEVYNEWYRPLGLTRALGLFVLGDPAYAPGLYMERVGPVVANVLLTGSPMSEGPEAERTQALLALVQPALAASVATIHRADWADLYAGSALDEAGVAAWLYDETGRALYESAATSQSAPEARAVAGAVAAGVLRDLRLGRPVRPSEAVGSGAQRLVLQASTLEPHGRRAPRVLVTARAETIGDTEQLRQRFGFTRRQSEVAGLLARRLTNGEIAHALFISPHTARHHTEAVLRQLGVTDRRDVAANLLGSR